MASELDLRELILRAKEGAVEEHELERVSSLLATRDRRNDLYRLLYIIGRSYARRYEGLVASYLEFRDDPMVARLALQVLCSFWGLTSKYEEYVRRFLAGVDWDVFGEVRQVAITAAGEYLNEHKNCGMLSELLNLSKESNEDSFERRIAIEALARAVGVPLAEALKPDLGDTPWEDWAREIRRRAAMRMSFECRHDSDIDVSD